MSKVNETLIITLTVPKGVHMPPKYFNYRNRTWTNINRCKDCHLIGLYEDTHTNNPCPNCGGLMQDYGAGRWIPKTESRGFFRGSVDVGYWECRNYD